MKIETVRISDLIFDPTNSRKHSAKNLEAIKGSLKRFGIQKPIVIDKKNVIIAGNGTVMAAKDMGWKDIQAYRTNLEGYEAMAFAISDNRTAELAEWEEDVLQESLAALQLNDIDISFLDFDLPDVGGTSGLTDADEVPEVEENIHGVQLGQIWGLGGHRLMCGDSTDPLSVARLMNGEVEDMVFTDPPYGLGGYKGRGKESSKPVQNDEKDPAQFYRCFSLAKENYVWGAFKNLKDIDFEPRDVIVWRKNNFGMGKGYRGQYEVCFYLGDFNGSDSDVWDVPKDIDYKHPTQKPVALAERAIKNSNPKLVKDVFLGSGSTLIACEKTGRKCYGMELDPHYCSVIIERWQKFSGKTAKLLKSDK